MLRITVVIVMVSRKYFTNQFDFKFYDVVAPVYGFWYVFTKLHEGLCNLTHFGLRTLPEGLFNIFKAFKDASSYESHLLLKGLQYGIQTLHESSNILLSMVFSGLWGLPRVIFRCVTCLFLGLYRSVKSATHGASSIMYDGLFGLWDALCHGTTYIINGVSYPLTAIALGLRQLTSSLFRVNEGHTDEETSQAAQIQHNSMMEESNRFLGSHGANIGTKYGTSAAKRRSSKRLRPSEEKSDDELMSKKENLNLTRSASRFSWLSWLQAGQIEVGVEDKPSDMFLATVGNDADDDNIGLWLLNRIQILFMFLLSPLSGIVVLFDIQQKVFRRNVFYPFYRVVFCLLHVARLVNLRKVRTKKDELLFCRSFFLAVLEGRRWHIWYCC